MLVSSVQFWEVQSNWLTCWLANYLCSSETNILEDENEP